MTMAPEVVVLPSAWDRSELVDRLGPDRTERLGTLMLERATAWANASFGADAVLVMTSPSQGDELIASAIAEAQPGRPLIAVVPELAVWRDDLAEALLDDLAAGCPLSVAPVFDGGFYLVAIAGANAAFTDLPAKAWAGRNALTAIVEAAAPHELIVGLLRTERALRSRTDLRSLLADPLTDDELRALLTA